MAKLYNLARMLTPTTGVGPIVLTGPVNSLISFAQAGAQDGDEVTYAIDNGNNREIGRGIYDNGTLTRNVLRSTNNNNPINLNGLTQVSIAAAAEDFANFIQDAPADGEIYARQDNQWVPIEIVLDGGTF
jgi:hypothetical protein